MSSITSRSGWRAQHRDGFGTRTVGRLDKYLHHTVMTHLSATATVAQEIAEMQRIERTGQSRFNGGISYTWIIFPSGRIYQGHSVGRVGAHTGGRNSTSVGIALAGNYQTTRPTAAQERALAWLLNEGVRRGWWIQPILTGGHRDVRATACPGNAAYPRIGAINTLARSGTPSSPTPSPAPKPTPKPTPAPKPLPSGHVGPPAGRSVPSGSVKTSRDGWIMKRLDLKNAHNVPVRGAAAGKAQALLLLHGYGPAGLVGSNGRPDRVAGAVTRRLLGQFQVKHDVGDGNGNADYVIGAGTWSKLIEG